MRNIIYISHGGGPLPLLDDPDHHEMVSTLTDMVKRIVKPTAILVISAHWEANVASITSALSPTLIYDYGGFPKEAYELEYPCQGQPELANSIYSALLKHGIEADLNEHRGFDHGVFVPLTIMYPKADIPCVQLSLVQNLDAELHIKIGEALAELDWDNLLVVGSGFSFHNMRAFFTPNLSEANVKNLEFEQWLRNTVGGGDLKEDHRRQQLIDWKLAPHARFCHPREEHLLPLHVCYGMAGKSCDEIYQAEIMNKQSSMFLWDE